MLFRADPEPTPLVRRYPHDFPGKVDHLQGGACTTRTDLPQYPPQPPAELQRNIPTCYMKDRLLSRDRKQYMDGSSLYKPGKGYVVRAGAAADPTAGPQLSTYTATVSVPASLHATQQQQLQASFFS